MASFLDIGILNYFVPAFVFLLVYGLILAILEKTKVFGDTKAANQVVALSVAVLFVLTPDLVGIVKIITPWFTVMLVFLLMIMMLFLFAGVKESDITKQFSDRGTVWIIIVIIITIFIYALTQVYGAQIQTIYGGQNATEQGGLNQVIGQIIFHPRILGMLFLLVVAAQAVRMISGGDKK
ncbi:MAG: hypothetical protein AABY09_00260 [Nanoarchaeota archaeon]